LFRKECFADQDHFSTQDPYEIIPEEYLAGCNRDTQFRAFKPKDKLKSDKEYKLYWKPFKSFKVNMFKYIENFDNGLGKPPLALRVVPLPGFTMNSIPVNKSEYNLIKIILNIFWFTFVPRWYKIGRNEKEKLSPFSRVVQYENNDDMYDNPATEAIIDFRWRKARNYFFQLFLRFLIFNFCFDYVSWAYINYGVSSEGHRNLLVVILVIFYYLAIYLFATEMIQLYYHGPRKYFNVFNIFDIISTISNDRIMYELSSFQWLWWCYNA
jgi:hypothetical protein